MKPVYPWSASHCGSPHVAGSTSRRDTEPQLTETVISSTTALSMFAGFRTPWESTTELIRRSATASVVAIAMARPSESGSSSTWAPIRRVGVRTTAVTWRLTSEESKVVSGCTR